MTTITTENILEKLAAETDPNTGLNYVSQKSIQNIQVEDSHITLDVILGYPAASQHDAIQNQIANALKTLPGITEVTVHIQTNIIAHQVQKGVDIIPGIKNIIAVASGKGGVGKSTTTANIALALAAEGARVGILDADIYGPSQQMMMNIKEKPISKDNQSMEPLMAHGIQVMSIGAIIDSDAALIWRGPMTKNALNQMLRQTNWDNLDYLIVDMPPGTGDVALTMAQEVPLAGAIIVTTPQDVALIDAQRGYRMFEEVNVHVIGIIENMSIHVCSQCGHAEHIFGDGGAQKMAQKNNVPYLGGLPLNINIRTQADMGTPTVAADPDSAITQSYKEIARKIAASIALRPRDYSSVMPKVKVAASS